MLGFFPLQIIHPLGGTTEWGTFVTSSLPGRTLTPREAGDMGMYFGAKVPKPRGCSLLEECLAEGPAMSFGFLGFGEQRQGAPLAHGALFSPFHWAWVLCQHLLPAGPQLLTPVAQPAVLLYFILSCVYGYCTCMDVCTTCMNMVLTRARRGYLKLGYSQL